MATNHDIRSRQCQRIFLNNFISGIWSNTVFSKDLLLKNTNKSWPSEDGNIYDTSKKVSIALEFKPDIETKRGIQTGLGQCFTYLEKFSASYLICPKEVEDFKISNYMKGVFENSIKGKSPVGLIEHSTDSNGEIQIEMLCDIDENFTLKEFISNRESRYWAKFIDTNPHLVYLLLKTAEKVSLIDNRKDQVWKEFFDNYYFPHENRNLEPFESIIDHWGIKKMEPFKGRKEKLKRKVLSGEITTEQAINEINEHCKKDGRPTLTNSSQNDNLYKSQSKNYLKFVDHLNLWDPNYFLTNDGEKYIEIAEKFGIESKELKLYFGKLVLETGNHFDLILDLEESIKNKTFESSTEARIHSQYYMEQKGLYKRNVNRAVVSGRTKIFQAEFQLYRKLNIMERSSYKNNQYTFNWEEIDKYLTFKP